MNVKSAFMVEISLVSDCSTEYSVDSGTMVESLGYSFLYRVQSLNSLAISCKMNI